MLTWADNLALKCYIRMFFESAFSEAGRASQMHLECLRRQLGMGIDPAFDYSKMAEMQKQLMNSKDDRGKKHKEDEIDPTSPVAGIEQLRKALREVVGTAGEPQEDEGHASPLHRSQMLHHSVDDSRTKDIHRASSSFLVEGRNDRARRDVDNKWRAPPPGSYRPKDHWMRPRVKDTDFGFKPVTKSYHTKALEEEIERLKADNQPYMHLVKSASSVELIEGIPENKLMKRNLTSFDMTKCLERPDLVKQAGIVYNVNSFTAGVADGHLKTSMFTRKPSWDIEKSSTAPEKDPSNYFQPGQYLKELQSSNLKNIPFTKQQARKPPCESIGRVEIKGRAGDHLPDRSLSRKSGAQQEPRIKVYDMNKYTTRPDILAKAIVYHDQADPYVADAVHKYNMTKDITQADRLSRPRTKPCEDFNKSLKREQQLRTMRTYGSDVCLQLAKEYKERGPVTVELLPMDTHDSAPSLRRRVPVRDFEKMERWEPSGKAVVPPPRKRDLSEGANFERNVREGDSRSPAAALSQIASGIRELRNTRS